MGKSNGIDSSTVIGVGVTTMLSILTLFVVIQRTRKR